MEQGQPQHPIGSHHLTGAAGLAGLRALQEVLAGAFSESLPESLAGFSLGYGADSFKYISITHASSFLPVFFLYLPFKTLKLVEARKLIRSVVTVSRPHFFPTRILSGMSVYTDNTYVGSTRSGPDSDGDSVVFVTSYFAAMAE